MNIALLIKIINTLTQALLKYAKEKWGIDIKKFLEKNPDLVPEKKVEIKTEKDLDEIMKKAKVGRIVKHQLKLDDLKNVYLRKMMNTKYQYYEVIFDSLYDRPLTFTWINNLTFYNAYLKDHDKYSTQKFTPPYRIEDFNNAIPNEAIIIKIDLAGKYYTKLKNEGVDRKEKIEGFVKIEQNLFVYPRPIYKKGKNKKKKIKENISSNTFMLCAGLDDTDMMETYLKQGGNINYQDEDGYTALMLAARWSRLDSIRFLIKNGADATIKNSKGMTALDYAKKEKGNEQVIRLLTPIELPEFLTEDEDLFLFNRFINAAYDGNIIFMNDYLNKGGDIDKISRNSYYGRNALMVAAERGLIGIVEFLLNHDADPTIKGSDGKTAYDLAKEQGFEGIMKMLRKKIPIEFPEFLMEDKEFASKFRLEHFIDWMRTQYVYFKNLKDLLELNNIELAQYGNILGKLFFDYVEIHGAMPTFEEFAKYIMAVDIKIKNVDVLHSLYNESVKVVKTMLKETKSYKLKYKKDLGSFKVVDFEVKVYEIDGQEVRDNINTDFTLGGHGMVYDYVPKNEIWVEKEYSKVDEGDIVAHEITEYLLMYKANMKYDDAHEEATSVEEILRQFNSSKKEQKKELADLIKEEKELKNLIKESILDPTQENLLPDIWEDNKSIKSKFRKTVIDIIDRSIGKIYDGVYFVGSLTGYNYVDDTDIDIHIIKKDIKKAMTDEFYKKLPINYRVKNHPLQFYVEPKEDFDEAKGGVYDLLKNKWVTESKKPAFKAPFEYVTEVAKIFMSGIDDRVQEFETDMLELQFLARSNALDKKTRMKTKERELEADLDSLYMLKNLLYNMRSGSYKPGKDEKEFNFLMSFGQGNESLQNMVYKMLEKAGYMEKIKKYLVMRRKVRDGGIEAIIDKKTGEKKESAIDKAGEEFKKLKEDLNPTSVKVGAGVLPVSRRTGKVLLGKRSDDTNNGGTWDIWGGKVENSDNGDMKTTAEREFREESGYKGNLELLLAYKYSRGGREFFVYLGIVDDEFKSTLSWETQSFKWMPFFKAYKLPNKHYGLEDLLDNAGDLIEKWIEKEVIGRHAYQEVFLNTFKGIDTGIKYNIYKNPSKNELSAIDSWEEQGIIRAVLDLSTDNLYVWDLNLGKHGEAVYDLNAVKEININDSDLKKDKYGYDFVVSPKIVTMEIEKKGIVTVTPSCVMFDNNEFSDLRKSKSIVKALTRYVGDSDPRIIIGNELLGSGGGNTEKDLLKLRDNMPLKRKHY
jgi:ankyrin repeat protein/8-oxo-dGTP pyrophosphatase MutT (NUDIX family)